MKALLLTLALLFSSQLYAQDWIKKENLSFKYKSFDGQVNKNCKHYKINEWYDWKVLCGDNKDKVFSVHLKVTQHRRTRTPKSLYEVLYWITDRTDSYKGTGTTVWFHLNEETSLNKISVSQSTDNDTAGLYLDIKPL